MIQLPQVRRRASGGEAAHRPTLDCQTQLEAIVNVLDSRWLPMEPVRYAGALAVRKAIKRCEDAEGAGRRPDPVSRRLRRAIYVSMPRGVETWRFTR